MQEKKGFFRRYWRTIGVFIAWIFLVAFAFGVGKEKPNAANVSICLIFFVTLEFALGYRMDRAAMRDHRARMEFERQRRETLGEEAWKEEQIKKKEEEIGQKKVSRQAIFLDLAMGCVYLAALRQIHGGDPKWLKDAIPMVFWFLITFPVFALWIIHFPRRKREGKIYILELLILAPFTLFPFMPLFSDRRVIVYILFTLGWCFSVMGIGYMRQVRDKEKTCTVMTTAKVIGNVKSPVRSKGVRRGDIPIYAYQPVLEYFANGEQKQVTCDDGQPNPLPMDGVYGIYYNPGNPEEFRFSDDRTVTERFGGPFFLGIGILMLAVAMGILVFS